MKPFDNYEIHPCKRHEVPDSLGQFFIEQCEPDEADFWTLYGHLPEGGVEAIGDFSSREQAEEVFQRITGIPFGGSREVMAHLKVMHAGPRLLQWLERAIVCIEASTKMLPSYDHARYPGSLLNGSRAVIAEATGRAS